MGPRTAQLDRSERGGHTPSDYGTENTGDPSAKRREVTAPPQEEVQGEDRRKAKVGRTSGGIKTAIMRATAPSVRVAEAAASLVGQTPKRDPSRRREDEVDGDGREVVGQEKSTSKSIPEEGRLIQGHQRRGNHAETKRDVGGQELRPGLQHCIAAANATKL